MAIEDKPYVGDVGTIIEAESEKNLTGNTTLRMEMIKPNGTTANWTATKKIGDDSIAQHVTVDGDFDQAGQYKGNLYVKYNGTEWHGETFCFEVFSPGE